MVHLCTILKKNVFLFSVLVLYSNLIEIWLIKQDGRFSRYLTCLSHSKEKKDSQNTLKEMLIVINSGLQEPSVCYISIYILLYFFLIVLS